MADLSDAQINWFMNAIDISYDRLVGYATDLAIEVQRHRAMVKRLEEWTGLLDEPGKGRALARELRNRMKGT